MYYPVHWPFRRVFCYYFSICLLYSKRGCLILASEARVIRSLDWAISSSVFALCFGVGGGLVLTKAGSWVAIADEWQLGARNWTWGALQDGDGDP